MLKFTTILFALSLSFGCASAPGASDSPAPTQQPAAAVVDSDILPTNGAPQVGESDSLVTLSVFLDPAASDFPERMTLLRELAVEREGDMRMVIQPASKISGPGLQAWRLMHFAAANEQLDEALDFLTEWHGTWRGGDPIALAISLQIWDAEALRDHLASEEFGLSLDGNLEFSERAGLQDGRMFVNGTEVIGATNFRSTYISTLAAAQALVAEGTPRTEIYATAIARNNEAANSLNIRDSDELPIGKAYVKGAPGAHVTIIGFMDLQCPYTARSWDTIKQVLEEYPQEARFVFKHRPLSFHKQARDAAIAAEAARRQGKFDEFVDAVFRDQRSMRNNIDDFVTDIAGRIGLDLQQFENDRQDPSIAELIEEHEKLADKVGARGTPNFRINGELVNGAQPFAKFDEVVGEQLALARRMIDEGESDSYNIYADAVARNFESSRPFEREQKKKVGPEPQLVKIAPADQFKGPADAPVTIVIFSDFQCPFCSRANPTLEQIEQQYGKKVRFVFKHLPLPFHAEAKPMAYAALAAGKQGKFWEMHDLLFENQRNFKGNADAEIERLAKSLKLDMKRFNKDMASQDLIDQVEADLAEAKRVGARGTPNFFINGMQVVGAQKFASFETVIDEQLKIADGLLKSGVKPADVYEEAVKANQVAHTAKQKVDADIQF